MKLPIQFFFKCFLLFGFIFSAQVFAKNKNNTKSVKTAKNTKAKAAHPALSLSDIVKKYRTTNFVKMKVAKIVKSELLSKETQYKGQMFLSKGKFRWDNDVPEKTQLIFDGTTIWNVQYPPPELPGALQIAKSKVDKNTKKQILISTLLSANGINENFKIKSTKPEGPNFIFELEPKSKDLGVTSLKIKASDKKSILEINYKDDVGNQTSLQFSDIEFLNKTQNKVFEYIPPKGAQVTHL